MECAVALVFFAGLFACFYLFVRLRRFEKATQAELQNLRAVLATLQAPLPGAAGEERLAEPLLPPVPQPVPTASVTAAPSVPVPALAPVAAAAIPVPAVTLSTSPPATLPPSTLSSPAAPSGPRTDWGEILRSNPLTRWFLDTHLVVRVGILILFIGVGFLVKYATDQGWFSLEMRLAAAGLLGVALVAVGWRVCHNRRGYGLSLQGAGLGIAYMTTFAAYALYGLIPGGLAFGLLAGLGLICGALAVVNDAKALAALAVTGGFAAPILAAGEGGSHIALFSYFALLNAAILGIAWFKAWRVLNLLGFIFTLVLASLWAMEYYRPEMYNSVQPFLILFFLFYVAIGLLFARRQPPQLVGLVDGVLVFGTPVIVAIWQARLVADLDDGLAWSAVALGVFYLLLGALLFRPNWPNYAMLRESYLAIGSVFVLLAVPFAFDAQTTVAVWAVAGVGLFWVGLRQGRRFHAALGGTVQVAVGLYNLVMRLDAILLDGPPGSDAMPFMLNSFAVGSLLLALAGLLTGYLALHYARRGVALLFKNDLYVIEVGATLWGLGWWYGIGLYELLRIAPLEETSLSVVALLFVLTAAVSLPIAGRVNWWTLRTTGLLLWLPVFILAGVEGMAERPLLTGWGWLAWPGALVVHYYMLAQLETQSAASGFLGFLQRLYHVGGLWLLAWLGTVELMAWVIGRESIADIWVALAWVAMPLLLTLGILGLGRAIAWPVRAHADLYLKWGLGPFAVYLALWTLVLSVSNNGDAAPLSWLPLLNPLGIAQILILAALFWWFSRLRSEGVRPGLVRVGQTLGVALFVVAVSGELARLAHQWWGIEFEVGALLDSAQLQATYSIVWTVLAMGFMFWGAWRVRRWLWLVGAALLGLTILKLFVVDLSGAETVARIVSFIGVGLLMLLIGYFAPMPPFVRSPAVEGAGDASGDATVDKRSGEAAAGAPESVSESVGD